MKNQNNLKLFSLKIIAVLFLLGVVVPTFAQKKGAATEAEIRDYFIRREQQSVDSMGWKNSQVTFQSIRIAAPVKFNFVDVGVQTCYPVKVSWTYSYENYNSRHTVSYTNDFYRFYRNEFGDLVMGEHGSFDDSKATDEPLGENKAADKPATSTQTQAKQTGAVNKDNSKNKGDSEYPAPDTSAMDKWYEITKFEYGDLAAGDNTLKFWFKPKVGHYDRPSTVFKVAFLNKDGAEVTGFAPSLSVDYDTEIGEVGQAVVKAPTEKQMTQVVAVKVIRVKE